MAKDARQVSVVGSSFYPGASNWFAKMGPGQPLQLRREPDNKYDKNAISVWVFTQQLGHLPRGFAAEIAPLIDAGLKARAWKSRDERFVGSAVIVVEWELPDDA